MLWGGKLVYHDKGLALRDSALQILLPQPLPEYASTRMGRAPPLALIEGSLGQIEGVATSD